MTTRTQTMIDETWTAERLRAMLRTHYGNEQVIVLANREPFTVPRTPESDAAITRPAIKRSTGGLVTALEPILQACDGVWVARGDAGDRGPVAEDRSAPNHWATYRVHRVPLTDREHRGYYCGFSNE